LNEKGPMECLKLAGHLNGLAWEQGDQITYTVEKVDPRICARYFCNFYKTSQRKQPSYRGKFVTLHEKLWALGPYVVDQHMIQKVEHVYWTWLSALPQSTAKTF
jgi:hypothetical protein